MTPMLRIRCVKIEKMFFCFGIFLLTALSAAYSGEKEWDALNRKAAQLYESQNFEDALQVSRQALKLAQEEFGPDHPNTAKSLNNLAVLNIARGQYDRAKSLYDETLAIEEKNFGADSAEVIETVYNLGRLYYLQKRYSRTDEMFLLVLEKSERLFGPKDPRVGAALENLVSLYDEMGLEDEAEEFARRADEIRLTMKEEKAKASAEAAAKRKMAEGK